MMKFFSAGCSSVSPSSDFPIAEWDHKMVLSWMKTSCIHTDVVKAIEKHPQFNGISLYKLTLEDCKSVLKLKERQAEIFMMYVDKLKKENIADHGEPVLDEESSLLNNKNSSSTKRSNTIHSYGGTAIRKKEIEGDDVNNNSVDPMIEKEKPTKDDFEFTMDLLYTNGEEDEEVRYVKQLSQLKELDTIDNLLGTSNDPYQLLMGTSAGNTSVNGIDINDPNRFAATNDSSSLEHSLQTFQYDASMNQLGGSSVSANGAYFASRQDEGSKVGLAIQSNLTNSTTTNSSSVVSTSDSFDNGRKKRKPKRCPPFPDQKLTVEEKRRRDFCLKKIQALRSPIAEKLHNLVSQDCVIPERYLYKYFNPDRSDRPIHSKKVYLKIRLVITEMSASGIHRIVRQLGSVVGALKDQTFGMYHSALIVGDYYVEWSDSSLATIRKKSSSKAVFAADVYTYRNQEDINQAFKTIADVICQWNGEKTYDNKKANCQHFCMDILNRLGLGEMFFDNVSGSVKNYLDKLKNYGVSNMTYTVDEKKRKLIINSKISSKELKDLVKGKEIVFPSHKLLDEFVYVIEKEGGIRYFEQDVTERIDYTLLKAFDRAFWLRNESTSANKEITSPLENESGETICPFSQVGVDGKLIDHTIHNTHIFTGSYSVECPER
ncbi:hypothetical protein ABK040_005223 [Willaertia magna]